MWSGTPSWGTRRRMPPALGRATGPWLTGTLAGFPRKPLCPCLRSASQPALPASWKAEPGGSHSSSLAFGSSLQDTLGQETGGWSGAGGGAGSMHGIYPDPPLLLQSPPPGSGSFSPHPLVEQATSPTAAGVPQHLRLVPFTLPARL